MKKVNKPCKRKECGKMMYNVSHTRHYCPECAEIMKKITANRYMVRNREKQKAYMKEYRRLPLHPIKKARVDFVGGIICK